MPYRRKYGRHPFKLRLKRKTIFSLTGLILILIAGITLLSFFGVSEPAVLYRDQVSKLFGFTLFLVPVELAIAGLYFLRVKPTIFNANTLVGFSLFLASLLSLGSVFSPDVGGVTGRLVAKAFINVFSTPGSIFILLILILVAIVIFFNTSFETSADLTNRSGKAVFDFIRSIFSGKGKQETDKEPTFVANKQDEEQLSPADKAAHLTATKEPVTNMPGKQVWEYPPLDLLTESLGAKASRGDIKQNAAIIEKTLDNFGIQAKVVEVNMGPAVTQYALEIALGTKLTKITGLANDIALSLSSPNGTVRIEAPIPGKSLVGIEVPNVTPEIATLRRILTSAQMQRSKSKLTLALGLNVSGSPVVDDLGRMPHVLVAGSTGSGKSVLINSFIATLLFRASPDEVKFILMDPKIVELTQWNGIPHLLTPVITDPEQVLSALKWALNEMTNRYKLFKDAGVRNIDSYNEAAGFQSLPYIVIIIDEFAHMMHFAPVEVEDAITKLAQMARATGVHMILATQRPSVDVITGLIKANIPCRIAFNVTSRVDSQVIIDQPGSEKLLGRGDMLYVPPDASKPQRIQGVFVSEPEINKLIEFLKNSGVQPQYTEEITTMPVSKLAGVGGGKDNLFEEAVRVIVQHDRASASLLQRRLRIGYARAARLLDEMEEAGVVGVADGSKARDVLVKDADRILSSGEETSE